MCGLRTRPRTDIDPPPVSRTAIGGGSISSRRPRGDSLLTRSSAVIKRYVWPTVDELAFGLYAAVACSERLDAITLTHTHTRTHPFNGPLSRDTRVSRYQEGKTNLNFTEARDSEWQRHQLGRMQVCTSLQTDNHASTPSLRFLQAGCPSCRPTNSVKALKAK